MSATESTPGRPDQRRGRARLHLQRGGARARRPDGRRDHPDRRTDPDPAGHAEPARPGRRRHRHRQDQDAAAARRAALGGRACRSSPPTSRATSPASRSPGAENPKVVERATSVGQTWKATGFPVEFFALGGQGTGIPLRKPMIGEVTRGTRTLFQIPGRLSWSKPAPTMVAPRSPPMSAWLLELGRPSRQVRRFQTIAPSNAAATIACVVLASLTSPAPIVLATAVPGERADEVERCRHRDGVRRPERLGGDGGRDGVRGVVEPVHVVEEDGQHEHDEQRQGHVFDATTPPVAPQDRRPRRRG